MFSKLIYILIFITISSNASAKPTVTASITPIASLVSLLTGDYFTVDSIANVAGSCPHSMQAKPSDYRKIMDSDLPIYIHEDFDGFAAKLMKKNKNSIKLSEINEFKIIKNDYRINWHFWLDIYNARIFLNNLSKILIKKYPKSSEIVESNLITSLDMLSRLEQKIKEINLNNILILDESLEYLSQPFGNRIYKLFTHEHKSLKYDKIIHKVVSDHAIKCLVISPKQSDRYYKKFNLPIIQIESENWEKIGDFKNLYELNFINFIEQLEVCINQ